MNLTGCIDTVWKSSLRSLTHTQLFPGYSKQQTRRSLAIWYIITVSRTLQTLLLSGKPLWPGKPATCIMLIMRIRQKTRSFIVRDLASNDFDTTHTSHLSASAHGWGKWTQFLSLHLFLMSSLRQSLEQLSKRSFNCVDVYMWLSWCTLEPRRSFGIRVWRCERNLDGLLALGWRNPFS